MFKIIGWALLIFVVVVFFFGGDDDKKETASSSISSTESVSKINQAGRDALMQQYNDPGYVESSFPTSSSFWIQIKDPPNPANIYAGIVCKQAKEKYNTKGFTITIWKLGTQDQYGKARCY